MPVFERDGLLGEEAATRKHPPLNIRQIRFAEALELCESLGGGQPRFEDLAFEDLARRRDRLLLEMLL